VTPVQSVREGEFAPVRRARPPGDAGPVVDVVRELLGSSAEGTVAVVVPWRELSALRSALDAALPGQVGDARGSALAARVSLLAPEQVKGLEFDDVVMVEPVAIVAASGRGLSDLYVALSRPTRRLVVIHCDPLPAGMEQLALG
jgi:pimeloyl-ACP methyl ester carboxylesterase